MNMPTIREFRLSPPGGNRGVSCDVNGAFVGSVPLLKRSRVNGRDVWQPRDCNQLSKQVGASYGVPIDMSSKMGGLHAISRALNEGDIARAQIATVLLGIPEPPLLVKNKPLRSELIKFIRDLHWSDLIKWDSDEHPRWPAGAPDNQGGRFAPKGQGTAGQTETNQPSSPHEQIADNSLLIPIAANARDVPSRKPSRKSDEECERQLNSDMYVCGSLRDRRERKACESSAMERYAACLRGKPMPPLTLPDPEYDFQPLPSTSPPRKPSPTLRWWYFLPWVLPEFGIPA